MAWSQIDEKSNVHAHSKDSDHSGLSQCAFSATSAKFSIHGGFLLLGPFAVNNPG